jgi:hypothetical protein
MVTMLRVIPRAHGRASLMRSISTLPASFAGRSHSFFTSQAQTASFPPRQEIYFLHEAANVIETHNHAGDFKEP